MRPIAVLRYVANDGEMFTEEADAVQRDEDLRQAALVLMRIGPSPDLGHGEFVQHSPSAVQLFHRDLVAWARERFPSWAGWPQVSPAGDELHRGSSIARYASEAGGPIADLWRRRQCIDNAGREWDQPYFAYEADEGRMPDVA